MEHIMAKLVEDFEQGRIDRRKFIQSLALAATAATAASAAMTSPAPRSQSEACAHAGIPVRQKARSHRNAATKNAIGKGINIG